MIDYNTALQFYLRNFPGAEATLQSPGGADQFNAFWNGIEQLEPAVLAGIQEIFDQKPDQRAAFARDYAGDLGRWLDGFTQWWNANGAKVADKLGEFGPELRLLDSLGFEPDPSALPAGVLDANGQPLEQAIAQTLTPTILSQVQGDADRQKQVADLTAQTNTAYGNLRNVLDQTALRTGADGQPTSNLLDAQRKNVDATLATVIDAAKTGAASTQAAVAQLTADQLANLSQSLATQRGAIATLTAEQLANLDQSLATQRQALAAEVEQLRGNATAAAQARLAALDEQLAALTAAQAPVAEARMRAAEGEATGINLALEGTRDQIAAEAAREGFTGPSSFTDAALARAAIDARQGAARTVGMARLANATDDRDIARMGAGTRFSIKDVLATDTQRVGDYGASGNRALSAWGAETGREVRDNSARAGAQLTGWGAETERGVNDAGAQGRFSIASGLADDIRGATTNAAVAKSGYFDQLYPAAVNSAQIMTGLPQAQAQGLTALIPFSTAGTRNALDTLSWFSGNATPPNPTAITTQPQQTGNQISNLGAGLLGAGFQIGNASNWWQQPRTTQPTTTPPASLAKNGPAYSAPWGGFTWGKSN